MADIELVTFAELKTLLDLDGETIAEYPALALLQTSVLSAIESYIGRALTSEARTKVVYIGGTPTAIIPLSGIPVASVSSVTASSQGSDSDFEENIDYIIDSFGIRLLHKIKITKLTIVYTGGLTETTGNLKRAALMQTAYEYQGKEQIGASYTSNEGGSVTRPELGLLKEVKRVLNSEKHPLRWT